MRVSEPRNKRGCSYADLALLALLVLLASCRTTAPKSRSMQVQLAAAVEADAWRADALRVVHTHTHTAPRRLLREAVIH